MNSILLFISMMLCTSAFAQNLGIGTTNPDYRLHISAADSSLLILENSTGLNTNIRSSLFFKTGLYYTAAIKSIGQSTNEARLGLFTYASSNFLDLKESVSILDNGFVGIGVTYPDYRLSVKHF